MNRDAVSSRRIAPPPPAEADIRLVAIDLDGTLLDDTKNIDSPTTKALQELPRRGVKVVIASARPPRSVRYVYHHLKLDTWQINYNGALIWDEPTGRPIFHQPMPGKLVRQVVDIARAEFPDLLVSCEILDRWYTDRFDPEFPTETSRLFKPDVIAPLYEFANQPITKLLLLGPDEAMEKLELMFTAQFDQKLVAVRTDRTLLQVMDHRVSKAAALARVATHYGVGPEQIMAIGDAPNDVGMLQLAGVAVAMENAHDAVKRVADWIAPSNNDNGVHAALVQYGLCK